MFFKILTVLHGMEYTSTQQCQIQTTCTVDNVLYAIQVALINSPELTAAFKSDDDATVRRL